MYRTYLKKNQRKRQNRLKAVVILAAFAVAVSMFLFGGNHFSTREVQASSAESEVVVYKSIQIQSGDTLWTIAEENMGSAYKDQNAYIKEVKKMNHITEKDIQTGSYIVIPCATVVKE